MSAAPIYVNDQALHAVSGAAFNAIVAANDPPQLFVRGGALARVRRDEDGRPLVDRVGESELRCRMARTAVYLREGKRQGDPPEEVSPPLDATRDLLALGTWPELPPLVGVTESPVLRPAGTVLDTQGYDRDSRLVYEPAAGFQLPPVPAAPTEQQVAAARDLLLGELLGDFPFADTASRAGALALLLTPVVRPAVAAPVPLAVLDATRAGTGKGLLASLAALVATGRAAGVVAAPVREEEWAKTLLSVLMAGSTFVLLDEAHELSSPALSAALTADVYEGRVLGRSEMVRLPNRCTWAAAGNNVALGGDIARRCYWVRLDAETSRPWQRSGFRHPDLLGWAGARRGELLAALLTLARAWWAAGCPAAETPALGSFTEWSRVVGGVLAHAGVSDFLGNLSDLYETADSEANDWEGFLATWYGQHQSRPRTVAQLVAEVGSHGALHAALPADLASAMDRGEASFKAKLGRALGKRVGTRYGDDDLRVDRVGQDARSTAWSWRVLAGGTAPDGARRGAGVAGVSGPKSPRTGARVWETGSYTPATPATPADEPLDLTLPVYERDDAYAGGDS